MNQAYINEQNKQVNEPIWLYVFETRDIAEIGFDLHFTNQQWDVHYFRWDDGSPVAQTYTAFAGLEHEGIEFNLDGTIPSPTLTLSNVNRQIQALLERNNFFRGIRVTVIKTYRNLLGDADANEKFSFFINNHTSNVLQIVFNLEGKLNLLSKKIPNRIVTRKCAAVQYKGLGCWLEQPDGTFEAPAGFRIDNFYLIEGTTSTGEITNTVFDVNFSAQPVNLVSLTQAQDKIKFAAEFVGPEINNADWDNANIKFRILSQSPNGRLIQETATKTGAQWNSYFGEDVFRSNVENAVELEFTEFSADLTDPNEFNLGEFSGLGIEIEFGSSKTIDILFTGIEFIMQKYSQFEGGEADSCDRTVADCRRHNNTAQYFGFLNVPRRN